MLVDNTDCSPEEVKRAITFLENHGLISTEDDFRIVGEEEEKEIHLKIRLETEGFHVARDREQAIENRKSNTAVALLTGILGLTAIIQSAIAFSNGDLGTPSTVLIGFLLLGVVVLWLWSWNKFNSSGALEVYESKPLKNSSNGVRDF